MKKKYLIILFSIIQLCAYSQHNVDSIVLLNKTNKLIEYYKPNFPEIKMKLTDDSGFSRFLGILDGVYIREDYFPFGRLENGIIVIYDRFYRPIEKYTFSDSSIVLKEEYSNDRIKKTEKFLHSGVYITTTYYGYGTKKQILIANDTTELSTYWHPNGVLGSHCIQYYETDFDSCNYFNLKGLYTHSVVNGSIFPSNLTYLDQKESHSYRIHTQSIFNNYLITGAGKEGASESWLWDLDKRKFIDSLSFPKHPINSVKFSPNGYYIGAGYGGYNGNGIKIWNLKDRSHIVTFKENKYSVFSIDFSPDSKYLITGGGLKGQSELILWDIENETLITEFEGHTDRIVSVSFSQENNLFASASNFIGRSEIIIWNYKSYQKVRTLDGNNYPINQIKFDENQSFLISVGGLNLNGYNSEIIIWNYETGKIQRKIEGCKYEIKCFAISSDSKYLITGGGYYNKPELIFWDYQTGEIIKKLTGHMDVISSVSFSSDGSRIITGSWDKRIIIWDIEKILNNK